MPTQKKNIQHQLTLGADEPSQPATDNEPNTAPEVLALAYQWHVPPPQLTDFDLALAIGRSDKKSAGLNYRCRFKPHRADGDRQHDVSGTIGLIYPASDERDAERAAASERMIADAIIWELAKTTFSQGKDSVVLIQGPLLPKLRGRILYRGVPANVFIVAVTSDPRWFGRIAGADILLKNIQTSSKFSPVYPPVTLDSATRCWIYKNNNAVYHIEAITNPWDLIEDKISTDKIRGKVELAICDSKLHGPSGEVLPQMLLEARTKADDTITLVSQFARHRLKFGDNLGKKISEYLNQNPPPKDQVVLDAATTKVDYSKPADQYRAFINDKGLRYHLEQ